MSQFIKLPEAIGIRTYEEAMPVVEKLKPCKVLAVDTETTGLSRPRDKAIVLAISSGEDRYAIWPEVFHHFKDLIEKPETKLIMHNANFDQWMLRNVGIDCDRYTEPGYARVYDTMVMHALINDQAPHDLKSLSKKYLGITMVPFRKVFGSQLTKKVNGVKRTLTDVLLDERNYGIVLNYAALDAFATYQLFLALRDELRGMRIFKQSSPYETMWDYYLDTELLYTKQLWHMELAGVEIDPVFLEDLKPGLEEEIKDIERWFVQQTNNPTLNLKSNEQLKRLFFGELGKEPMSFTEKGAPQLNAAALKRWAVSKDKCIFSRKLLDHRDKVTKLNTYVLGIQKLVHTDGRVHTSFRQTGARTGRLSCVAGSTMLRTQRGVFTFEEYVPYENDVVVTHTGSLGRVKRKIYKGVDTMFRVGLANGAWVDCTADHRVLTPTGWARVGDLSPGDSVWSYEHGCVEEVHEGSAKRTGGPLPVSVKGAPHNPNHCRQHGDDLPERQLRGAPQPRAGKTQGGEGFEVFPIKNRVEQPNEGKDRSEAPQPHRGYRHGGRVPAKKGERKVRPGTPHRNGRPTGSRDPAPVSGGSPHRRGPSEQRPQQFGGSHPWWPPTLALEEVSIREITPLGTMGVWDIEVEGDHSYAAQGLFHHNSSDPNLQNQPAYIRGCYVASRGHMLKVSDYDQLEMRILAHMSRDDNLCDIIIQGKDVHAATAAIMFDSSYDDIVAAKAQDEANAERILRGEEVIPLTDYQKGLLKQRKAAKTINFGLMYGQGPGALAFAMGWERGHAIDVIDEYFNKFSRVRDYFDDAINAASAVGYCQTLMGRRRHVGNINSFLNADAAAARRVVKNSPIQGTASEITKLAQLKLWKDPYIRNAGGRMLIQVHDEVMIEAPEEFVHDEEFNRRVRENMEHPFEYDLAVPLTISTQWATDWATAK